MRARGCVIHLSRSSGPAVVAQVHVSKELVIILHREIGKVFDVGSFSGRLANLEIIRGIVLGGARRGYEISNVFMIDFKVGY